MAAAFSLPPGWAVRPFLRSLQRFGACARVKILFSACCC
jgi:hypothetical protein